MVAVALLVFAVAPGVQLLRDGRVRIPRSALVLATTAAGAAGMVGVMRGWPAALVALQAVTVAASVLVVAVPATKRSLLFAGLWVLLVQLPLGFAVFDVSAGFETRMGALDFAGGLSVGVALGVAILFRGAADRRPQMGRRTVLGGLLTAGGLVAACVAAETVFDAVIGRILLACVLSAAAGSAGWLVARLIAAGRLAKVDPTFGVMTGLSAALPACAWVTPQWSLLIGVAAGAIGGLLAGRFARRHPSGVAACAAMLIAGGTVGTFALGLFVDGSGLVHTGAVDQVIAQLQATTVTVGWSMMVSLVLALVLRSRTKVATDDVLADAG